MCQVFSCIVHKTGKVYSQKWDPSHTQIAIDHGLKENGKAELLRAKVEITPPRGRYDSSLDQWNLKVDEDDVPVWWTDRHDRNARAALEKWARKFLFPYLKKGYTQYSWGGMRLTKDDGSYIRIYSGGEREFYNAATNTYRYRSAASWRSGKSKKHGTL